MQIIKKFNSNFFRQSVKSLGYNFFSIAFALINITILTKYLGKDGYGIWITLFSICNWISFLDGGFGNSLRNELTISLHEKDIEKSRKLISTAYISLFLFLLLFFIILVFGHLFFDWSDIVEDYKLNYNLLALAIFGFFLIQMTLKLIGKIFFSVGKGQRNFLMGALVNGGILASLFICYNFNLPNKLWNVAAVYSIVPIIVILTLSVLFYLRSKPELQPSFKDFEVKYVNLIILRGGQFFLIQMSSGLLQAITPFFITLWITSTISAEYYISIRYYSLVLVILNIFLQIMWGDITLSYAQDKKKALTQYLKRSFSIGLILIIILLIMYILSQFIYSMWVGEDFGIDNKINFICLLSVISVVMSKCFTNVLNAVGKITFQSYVSVFIIFLYVPSIYIAVKVMNLGIAGLILTPSLFFLIQGFLAYYEIRTMKIKSLN